MPRSSLAFVSYSARRARNWLACGSTISSGNSTLSSVVRHGSMIGFWNAMPTMLSGADTSCPATSTPPRLGRCRPDTSLSRVDLPQPEGPTTATNSPFSICSVRQIFGREDFDRRHHLGQTERLGHGLERARDPIRTNAAETVSLGFGGDQLVLDQPLQLGELELLVDQRRALLQCRDRLGWMRNGLVPAFRRRRNEAADGFWIGAEGLLRRHDGVAVDIQADVGEIEKLDVGGRDALAHEIEVHRGVEAENGVDIAFEQQRFAQAQVAVLPLDAVGLDA